MARLKKLSFGYVVNSYEEDRTANIRVLKDISLMECSFVTFPANPETRVTAIKNDDACKNSISLRDFEATLRSVMGYSRKQAQTIAEKDIELF